MSDLNLIESGWGLERGRRRPIAWVRRAFRRILHPWLVRLASILMEIVGRMDRAEWQAEVLKNQANNLGTHLESLSQRYWSLEGRFEGRVGQIHAILNSFPGVDSRFDALDEKLQAFEALHWDHVALVRRLGAIEDVLNASGEFATRTIEEGRDRPLLPFPGFEGQAGRCSEAS